MDLDKAYEAIEKYEDAGPVFSLFSDKWLLVAIFGIAIVWEGVGLAWLLPSIYVDDYKKSFHKLIKGTCELIAEANHLHRVQCYVHKSFIVSQKWVEHLGFEREGLLRQFSADKKDYYVYGRLL